MIIITIMIWVEELQGEQSDSLSCGVVRFDFIRLLIQVFCYCGWDSEWVWSWNWGWVWYYGWDLKWVWSWNWGWVWSWKVPSLSLIGGVWLCKKGPRIRRGTNSTEGRHHATKPMADLPQSKPTAGFFITSFFGCWLLISISLSFVNNVASCFEIVGLLVKIGSQF